MVGLIPAAENAIGGNALRPGDVIRHYGGRTSEVTNTDAEGRLVLADAMAWAVAHLDPAVLVDVATLTGAIKVALGQQVGGVFANDDALADALLESATSAGEPLWRFPLASVYEERLVVPGRRRRQRSQRTGRDHRRPVPPALRRRRPVGAPRPRLDRRRPR